MKPYFLLSILLLLATPAVACKFQVGIGGFNTRIGKLEARVAAHEKLNKKQRAVLAEYRKDSAAYKAAFDKTWPVCTEGKGNSCFAGCEGISEKELAAAPFVVDGMHYRVSPEEAERLNTLKQQLTEKWKH